jgi:ribose-phosphate pyrophosphokinase
MCEEGKVQGMKNQANDFMVFSGTANLPLAEKVAAYLGRPLNKIDIRHFPDGETFCQVQEGVRGKDVFVIQSGSPRPNDAYMELFVIMDALKRGSAARITAVLPYYGYARQDRKDQPRVPITARLIANLLESAGADRVLTLDLHANQIQGFFDVPLDHLRAEPVILKYIRDQHWGNPIVVAPDTGGAKTAYGYSRKLGCGLAIVAKQRTGGDTVDAFSVVGDVRDHDVIMIDDMTATGGTLSAAAKMCRENGARSVHAFVSHFPLTAKGEERLMSESQLDELVVCDTIPVREGFDPSKLPFKLTQLSVAPLIGEAIKRIHNDESINDLFNHE